MTMKIRLFIVLLNFVNVVIFAQHTDMQLLKAKTLVEYDQSAEALIIFKTILPGHKTDPVFYKESGNCFYKKNDFTDALKAYLTADSLRKDYASFEISKCYANTNNFQLCLIWLRKYLLSTDKVSETTLLKEPSFALLKKTKEWERLWETSWYSDSEIAKFTVKSLLNEKRPLEAQEELEKYEKRFRPQHLYYFLLANAMADQGQINPALYAIDKAIELNSRMDAYFIKKASLNSALKNYKQAMDDIAAAIKLNPYEIDSYYKHAEVSMLSKDMNHAAADLDIIKNILPDAPHTIHLMAFIENARCNYQNSLEYYDRLIEKDKTDPAFFLERGHNEFAMQQFIKADEDFGMALDLNPNLMDAYLQKGKTLILLGDSLGACNNLFTAQHLGSADATKLIYENCKQQ